MENAEAHRSTYLSQDEDIRFALIVINRKSVTCATKTSLNFVRNQKDVILFAYSFHFRHVTIEGNNYTCLALNGLYHEGGDIGAILDEFGLQLIITQKNDVHK